MNRRLPLLMCFLTAAMFVACAAEDEQAGQTDDASTEAIGAPRRTFGLCAIEALLPVKIDVPPYENVVAGKGIISCSDGVSGFAIVVCLQEYSGSRWVNLDCERARFGGTGASTRVGAYAPHVRLGTFRTRVTLRWDASNEFIGRVYSSSIRLSP
jgi:hypothetical protein